MRLLERDVFFFTTFGGEALSLAAARATIGDLRDHDVPGHLERQGRTLQARATTQLAAELGLDVHPLRRPGLPHAGDVRAQGPAAAPTRC